MLLKQRVSTNENEACPGSSTWISAWDKTQKRHVLLISASCLHLSISMQIIHDDSAESCEPSLGMRNSHNLFLVPWLFLTLLNKRKCCRGVCNSPRQPKRKGWQITPLLWVWQEHAIKLLSTRNVLLQEERTCNKKITHIREKYIPWRSRNVCGFCLSPFQFPYMVLALECKSLSVFHNYTSIHLSEMEVRKVKITKLWILL